jgi:SAM-dependent methyltransferase
VRTTEGADVPALLSPRATWAVLRAGDLRTRLRAVREGHAALRLHLTAAAVTTGLVDALAAGPRTTAQLADALSIRDEGILAAWLRTTAGAGLLRRHGDLWDLTRSGRALQGDDLARASYEAFADFHTGLYRELGPLLRGGTRRRDVAEKGGLIARVSAGFEPFVLGELTAAVRAVGARRVLDVGCGAGVNLVTMVSAGPDVRGVGLDLDADAVALARQTVRSRELDDRAAVLQADVRDVVRTRPPELAEPFELALLANVLYYLPPVARVPLLRDVVALLAPGGRLLVITLVADPVLFSRHFDLLLRAQEGDMQLSDGDVVSEQLRHAGLAGVGVRRLVPGQPLVLATGTRT